MVTEAAVTRDKPTIDRSSDDPDTKEPGHSNTTGHRDLESHTAIIVNICIK
jgi:hypothetical protein